MTDKFHVFEIKNTRFTVLSKDGIDAKTAYNIAALHHFYNPELTDPITIVTSSSAAEDILQQFAESLQNQEEQ